LTPKPTSARGNVAHIECRRLRQPYGSGRTRAVVHYKVRYRDATGKHHSETKTRLVDAERRKAEIEVALATATWRDPRRGELSLAEWANAWLPTRLDLRPTTWARLETTMHKQVLPYFGSVPLNKITNAVVREWVSTLLSSGLSAATTWRKEMINELDRLMTITDLSEMLGVPVDTLYGWRHRGEGPAGYRIGRHVRYRRATVEAWLDTQADRRQR